jgi:NitT/TauT family transport system permease protein
VASPLVLLCAWELLSASGVVREAFFPRPTTVIRRFAELTLDGTLGRHAVATVARLALASVLATVPGVAVGLAMGTSRRARQGLDALFAVIYPIPSVLFLPLASFLMPSGEAAMILTTSVTSFFLVVYTTMTGVQQIDRLVLEAAAHYGAAGRRLLLTVLIPGALPSIMTGFRLGLGYAVIVGIAVEIVTAKEGLGAFLWLSWQILRVEDMYAGLIAVALLGAVVTYGMEAIRVRLLPWVQDPGR